MPHLQIQVDPKLVPTFFPESAGQQQSEAGRIHQDSAETDLKAYRRRQKQREIEEGRYLSVPFDDTTDTEDTEFPENISQPDQQDDEPHTKNSLNVTNWYSDSTTVPPSPFPSPAPTYHRFRYDKDGANSVPEAISPGTRSAAARNSLVQGFNRSSVTPEGMLYPPPPPDTPHPGTYIDPFKIPRFSANRQASNSGHGQMGDQATQDELPADTQGLPAEDLPNGGWLARGRACSAFLVAFNCWGYAIASGVFQAYYAYDLLAGSPQWQIAWVFSAQLFLLFFLGTSVGCVVHAGYFRWCFNGGSILLVLAVILTSFCTKWWQLFLCQGLLTGLAQGLVFGSAITVLSIYSSKNTGLALSIGAAGSNIGAVVYAATFQQAIGSQGFGWTVRYMACIMFATLALPNMILQPHSGLLRKDFIGAGNITINGPYLLMTAGLYLAFQGVFIGFIFIVSYGRFVLELPEKDSISLLIAMCTTNLPGMFIAALISDRCVGPLNTIITSCLLTGMVASLWIQTSSHSDALAVACFYGFFSAGIQTLRAPAMHIFDADPETSRRRSVLVLVAISVACLAGPPIAGALIAKENQSYLGLQVFTGCSLMLGGVLLLLSRGMQYGWGFTRA